LRKYEALFIISHSISEDQMDARISQISSEITKLGGSVQAATRMGRITFARPLAKKEAGNYVQIVFMMEPDKANLVHERFRRNEDILRLQIIAGKNPAGAKNAPKPKTAATA